MPRTLARLLSFMLVVALLAPEAAAYEQEIGRLTSSMAEKLSRSGKVRIAVVDFTDLQGRVTELGRFLAEEFSISLAGSDKGLRVVDRTHLRSILEEHKLAGTGLIDPATARQLGKIAGVEALVTATLTPLGESVRISVKVLDTETADVIDAATGSIARTEAIAELLRSTVTVSSSTTGSPPRNAGSPEQTLELGQVRFALDGCRRSGQQVKCEFLVTALESDETIRLFAGSCGHPSSRVFDVSGNEFPAAAAYIGAQRHGCEVRHHLVAGVSLKAGWVIHGIPPEVSTLAALDFGCYAPSVAEGQMHVVSAYRLQLRSVPVAD